MFLHDSTFLARHLLQHYGNTTCISIWLLTTTCSRHYTTPHNTIRPEFPTRFRAAERFVSSLRSLPTRQRRQPLAILHNNDDYASPTYTTTTTTPRQPTRRPVTHTTRRPNYQHNARQPTLRLANLLLHRRLLNLHRYYHTNHYTKYYHQYYYHHITYRVPNIL